MFYVWIAVITFASTAGGIAIGIWVIHFKQKRHMQNWAEEKKEKAKLAKSQALVDAFLELKENIAHLESISELVKEEETKKINWHLKNMKISKVYHFSRVADLGKEEFRLIDRMHSIMVARRKIGFYVRLYGDKKISLLELRAHIEDFIEEARQTRDHIVQQYKQLFV